MATVQKELDKWQPDWVALRILDFARKVHEFGNDDKALAEWTRQMSEDLIFNNTSSEDEFTQNLLAEASDAYAKKSKAGRKGGIAKARKQKQKPQEVAGNGNAPDASVNGLDEYHDQETASGNYQVPDKVSTNNGDAARREAADGESNGNVTADCTTVSTPLALDMLGLDKASNPRGYNTADVPPSYGPENGTIDNPATPAGSSHPAGNTPPQFVINHNQRHRPQKPQANSPPRSSEDVRLFALDRNLDIDDARMWYQMNFVDRPGCDKNGVAINNWKGHCTAYCKAEAERRKAG